MKARDLSYRYGDLGWIQRGGWTAHRGDAAHLHGDHERNQIVPLVDVVLVLLIIFMLTAHVMEFGLEINVPEVKQVSDTAEELPVVSITRDAKIYLNERPVNINQLPAEIARRFKGAKAVYVSADRRVVFDPVAQVLAELGEAKFDVNIVAKPIETQR